MIDAGDTIKPEFNDLRQRQKEVQKDKRTDRTLALYNDTFQNALPEGIISFLKQRDLPSTWVDLGCGNGLALQKVAQSEGCENTEIIGIDIRDDVQPISQYPEYNHNVRKTGLFHSLQNMDGNSNLTLPNNSDLITCLMVDRYLKDIMPMIIRSINSLSEDGIFLMTSSCWHYVRNRKWKSQNMLQWYLRDLLEETGGSLSVVNAGNKDGHLGDFPTDVWVIKRGRNDISVNYEINDVSPLLGGGYSQEYWVD